MFEVLSIREQPLPFGFLQIERVKKKSLSSRRILMRMKTLYIN